MRFNDNIANYINRNVINQFGRCMCLHQLLQQYSRSWGSGNIGVETIHGWMEVFAKCTNALCVDYKSVFDVTFCPFLRIYHVSI